MTTRRLKTGGRRKALFGSTEAAILTAAGINATTQITAAGINSAATRQAARDQAKATTQSAQRQAQAIKDQTARSREYQQESQEFVKEQNSENRELQKDIQMQLAMLTGQQNVNDRLEASKIKVRNGGSTRRRLKYNGNPDVLLRGSFNMPFKITDGGGAIALGTTPEGFDLYELFGNDHNHYHKAQGGKHKTGVGIKFADGNVVEGEGNQNGPNGEKMLVTPDNAYFISRHTIKGFNPAKSVDEGMNPLIAYLLQEQIKDENGISDDGESSSHVKSNGNFPRYIAMTGGMLPDAYSIANQSGPQLGVDTVAPTAVGVAYASQNPDSIKRKLRCGGKARHRAANGSLLNAVSGLGNMNRYLYDNILNTSGAANVKGPTNNTTAASSRTGGFWNNADLMGAGITGLGNIGGALITSIGNRSAAKTLANAYNTSASILSDAYNSMKTIDMSSIKKDDYAAAHVIPALQAPVSMAASKIADVNRQLQRRLDNAGKYSASGAASLNRMARAETDAQDMRNRVWSADQEQMQNIRQANAQRVSEAAVENARLDTAANQQYASDYLKLLQYNNDIENQKILGAAGASAEGAVNGANALSQAQTANAAAWAQSLAGTSQGFANSLSNMATRKADLEKVKLGASGETQASFYANSSLTSEQEARNAYAGLVRQYNMATDKDTKNILKRRANLIAAARGFNLIA